MGSKKGKVAVHHDQTAEALADAVRALREHSGESQQAFAVRFGLSVRSIGFYEKDRTPENRVLAMFATAASEAGRDDLVQEFMEAIGRDLHLKDIKGAAVLVYRWWQNRGFLLAQFELSGSSDFAKAFLQTLHVFESGDPQEKKKAEKLIGQFRSEVKKAFGVGVGVGEGGTK